MKIEWHEYPERDTVSFTVEVSGPEIAQLPRGIPSLFMASGFPISRRLKALAEAAALLEMKSR